MSQQVSVEAAVIEIARRAHLSPRLASLLLLALLCDHGHALVRLQAPGADPRLVDDAVRTLANEVQAVLSRLFARETLVVPALDAALETSLVSSQSKEVERTYLQKKGHARTASGSSVSLSAIETHCPQALVLPRLDNCAASAQVAFLEAIRGDSVHQLPADFLFVAVVANDADYGGLFKHLADRIALSCTFTLSEVSHLEGGLPDEFRSIPLEPLMPALPPLHHPLTTYCSDLLTALRLHPEAPSSLITARTQRFLFELVARRAALAGHEPSPADARFVLESLTAHRLPSATAKAAIEDVIDIV